MRWLFGRKAQVAYEFIFVFFTLTLGFTVWIMFSSAVQEDFQVEQLTMALDDFGLSIQDDLYTAIQMPEGFSRTFELPVYLLGFDYSMGIYNMEDFSIVEVNVSDQHLTFFAPPLNGTLNPGINYLKTIDGTVCINNIACLI